MSAGGTEKSFTESVGLFLDACPGPPLAKAGLKRAAFQDDMVKLVNIVAVCKLPDQAPIIYNLVRGKKMNWYDRTPVYVIALLTSVIWGAAVLFIAWALGRNPSLLASALVAVLGAVFAFRERKARRRAGLAQ